jgi:hypothetical protein
MKNKPPKPIKKKRQSKSSNYDLPDILFSEMPNTYLNPLFAPVSKPPVILGSFYMGELIDWVNGKAEGAGQLVNPIEDKEIKITIPDIREDKNNEKICDWGGKQEETSTHSLEKKDFENTAEGFDLLNKSYTHYLFLSHVLQAVKDNMEEFVSYYASKNSLKSVLAEYGIKGELIILEIIIAKINEFAIRKEIQLIPTLYHNRSHGLLMSFDITKLKDLDISPKEETFKGFDIRVQFEFRFSKETSDSFSAALVDILNGRKEELSDIISAGTKKENNTANNEFTTARQVLAIFFLLKEQHIWQNSDKTEVARFIQFLTGKETKTDKIKNTNIYKYTRDPIKLTEKEVKNDLLFIRKYFQGMGFSSIVSAIDKEIEAFK